MRGDRRKIWERRYAGVWVYVTDGDIYGRHGFMPWSGGCGIGVCRKTKEQAIATCMRFAKKRLTRLRSDLMAGVSEIDTALEKLIREAKRKTSSQPAATPD